MGHWKRKDWVAKLASVVCGLGLMGTAHAVVYVGQWDPQYGTPFTTTEFARVNLGWSGEIKLDVDDFCVVDNGDVTTGSGCEVSVQYAFAEIYDFNNPTDILRLNFNPVTFDVQEMRFSSGNLVGLQTGFFSNFVSDGGFTYVASDPIFFALKFVLDEEVGPVGSGTPILYSGALLPWARPGAPSCGLGEPCGFPNVVAFPPNLQFTLIPPNTVPLPGTAALVLLALGVAAAVARRR